jgi:hypothetical protein
LVRGDRYRQARVQDQAHPVRPERWRRERGHW